MSNEFVRAATNFLNESWYKENAGTLQYREAKYLEELLDTLIEWCVEEGYSLEETHQIVNDYLFEAPKNMLKDAEKRATTLSTQTEKGTNSRLNPANSSSPLDKLRDNILSGTSRALDSPLAKGFGNYTKYAIPQFTRNSWGYQIDAANKLASDLTKNDYSNVAQVAKYTLGATNSTPSFLVPNKFQNEIDKRAKDAVRSGLRPGQTTSINSYQGSPANVGRNSSAVPTTLGRYGVKFEPSGKSVTSFDRPYGFERPTGRTPQERIRDQEVRGKDLEAVPWYQLSASEKNQTAGANGPTRGLGNLSVQLRSVLGGDPNKSFTPTYTTPLPKNLQQRALPNTPQNNNGSRPVLPGINFGSRNTSPTKLTPRPGSGNRPPSRPVLPGIQGITQPARPGMYGPPTPRTTARPGIKPPKVGVTKGPAPKPPQRPNPLGPLKPV